MSQPGLQHPSQFSVSTLHANDCRVSVNSCVCSADSTFGMARRRYSDDSYSSAASPERERRERYVSNEGTRRRPRSRFDDDYDRGGYERERHGRHRSDYGYGERSMDREWDRRGARDRMHRYDMEDVRRDERNGWRGEDVRDRRPHKRGDGETFAESRRRIRELGTITVWTSSPSPPRRLSDRLEVVQDERLRKERKRQRKEERRQRREAKRARRAEREKKEAERVRAEQEAADVEEYTSTALENHRRQGAKVAADEALSTKPAAQSSDSESDTSDVGPKLPGAATPGEERTKDYGKALRPGEGSAMAAFVQEGKRIPRRGEIGLKSDEIADFEAQGYVMSGSRNRRMEAVRIRKENQVYSAEELAALSQFSHEEKKLREERMLNQFRSLVKSKMGEASGRAPDVARDK